MRFWDRVRVGFGIVFGKKYGIIVDQDYASGGDVCGFDIEGADVAIYVTGSGGKKYRGGTLIEGNAMRMRGGMPPGKECKIEDREECDPIHCDNTLCAGNPVVIEEVRQAHLGAFRELGRARPTKR